MSHSCWSRSLGGGEAAGVRVRAGKILDWEGRGGFGGPGGREQCEYGVEEGVKRCTGLLLWVIFNGLVMLDENEAIRLALIDEQDALAKKGGVVAMDSMVLLAAKVHATEFVWDNGRLVDSMFGHGADILFHSEGRPAIDVCCPRQCINPHLLVEKSSGRSGQGLEVVWILERRIEDNRTSVLLLLSPPCRWYSYQNSESLHGDISLTGWPVVVRIREQHRRHSPK